jgi:hypothetical protein
MTDPQATPQRREHVTAPFRIAWRIKYHIWHREGGWRALVDLFDTVPEAVDQVVFFGGEYVFHHGYWPLEDLAERMDVLAGRMDAFREQGRSVGVNILSTHGAEAHGKFGDHLPPLPYQGATSPDGTESKKVAAPADPDYLDWSADLYRLTAGTDPDVIWVDDHMGTPVKAAGDFSPASLAGFDDGRWSREELLEALNDPGRGDLRKRWLRYQTDVLARYCRVVARAAREVKPDVDMGLMTVGFATGKHHNDFYVDCMEQMQAGYGRPGHGFYTDEKPHDMLKKWMEVSAQTARYPACVREVQYEFEDWPSNVLKKSRRTVANEITGAIMNGCTGVAFNHLHEFATDFAEHLPVLKMLARRKDFWSELVEECRGLPQAGLYNAVAPRYAENAEPAGEPWSSAAKSYDATAAWRWLSFGIPITGDASAAPAAVLTSNAAAGMSAEELRPLLAGGCLVDEGALARLWDLGLGEPAGVRPLPYAEACYERYLDHPVNAGCAGSGRSPVWWGTSPVEPVCDGVEVASRVIRFDGERDFGACVTLYENELGGRIVHLGLDPFEWIGMGCKMQQLYRLVDWASRGRFPLRLARPATAATVLCMAQDGSRFVLMVQNTGFDDLQDLRVQVRSGATSVRDLATGERLSLARTDGDTIEITVQPIRAWDHRVIVGRT